MAPWQQNNQHIELYCLGCKNGATFQRKKKTFKARTHSKFPFVTSQGLKQHLNSTRNSNCLDYYRMNDLIRLNEGIDFCTSLTEQQVVVPSVQHVSKIAPQIGLTLTANGPGNLDSCYRPVGSNNVNLNATLNNQVTYNALQQPIQRNLIESLLSTEQDEYITSDDEFNGNLFTSIDDIVVPGPQNNDNSQCADETPQKNSL